MNSRHLLSGIDTIECAYWLAPTARVSLDFEKLAVEKAEVAQTKSRQPVAIRIGSEEFLLAPHGTASGYPLLLQNDALRIQCGEFNKPNFFVAFTSFALWHNSAEALNDRFLHWVESVGMEPYRPEKLSRVDLAFDYHIPAVDFDEDCFVSQADKDAQHRKARKVQTFRFGVGDVVLRVYNKSDEIAEQSAKVWLYPMWGADDDIWRIELQVRKELLKRFGIRSFEDLDERKGDLLRYLINEHTTLRVKGTDSNRSRWPLHPLWIDLQSRVHAMAGLGVVRECDRQGLLEERATRIAVSIYGNMKQFAALHGLMRGGDEVDLREATRTLYRTIDRLHDPLDWESGVNRRKNEIRLGQW